MHSHLWIRRRAEANSAVCPYGLRGGTRAPSSGVQASPETQTCGAVQQRCTLWAGLGCRPLGGSKVFLEMFLVGFFASSFHQSRLFEFSQCPVTCGGGVRSRTVTCAIAPQKTCDLATKPRTRSLCALQSCPNSSLRRRPGPPPKYRRVYPPKINPTTRAPTTAKATAAPTPMFTATKDTADMETTTSLLNPRTTGLDVGDYDFNVVVGKKEDSADKEGFSTESTPAKNHNDATEETKRFEEREDGEDGSTPNVFLFTPGYVLKDTTRAEEEIIDLDNVPTGPSLTPPGESTTSMPHVAPLTVQTSRPVTSSSFFNPQSRVEMSETTTHRFSFTGYRTPKVPLASPTLKHQNGVHATRAPSTTARQPVTTAVSPTGKVIKLKKPAVAPKKPNSASKAKKPSSRSKGAGRSKGQNQRPAVPRSRPTGNQGNLMAREPVSMDVLWVVGNWSEVRTFYNNAGRFQHHMH